MTGKKQREITITEHALIQYQVRRRDFRPYSVIEEEIRQEVLAAFAAGRIRDNRPMTFMLYGRNNKQLPPGQRLALNEDESMAWILKRESDADIVMTTLTRTVASR
jgi:hypothetical protein